jgi:toxin ParE1/3/4
MARYRIARRAGIDPDDIWLTIAERDSPVAADRVLARLYDAFVSLSLSPRIGARRFHFGPNLRMFPVYEYLIFYRPMDDGVEIVRVLHGKRNITKDSF